MLNRSNQPFSFFIERDETFQKRKLTFISPEYSKIGQKNSGVN